MNSSKNHVVCARCHLTGEASSMLCSIMSSGQSGAASASVRLRVSLNSVSASLVGSGLEAMVIEQLPLGVDSGKMNVELNLG